MPDDGTITINLAHGKAYAAMQQEQIARLVREVETYRRMAAKFYEKNRLLENAIRKAHLDNFGDEPAMNGGTRKYQRSEALAALYRRVPAKPRKKWGWRGREDRAKV